MPNRRARLVVVGLGAAGSRHALTAATCLPNAELVALVERDATLARIEGQRYDVPCREYEDVLNDSTVDGVIIATPTPLHPAMIKDAAAAGKHVFCEKPLGLDLDESAEAVAVANHAGVLLQTAFVRRFEPAWVEAARRVTSGEIGEVYFFRAGQREQIIYESSSYLEQVGNFYEDVLVHEFDLARWLVGDVVEVHAWAAEPRRPAVAEAGDTEITTVQLRFANGAIGSVDGTMLSAHGYDCYTEVLGSEGALRVGYSPRVTDVTEVRRHESAVAHDTDFRKRFEVGFVHELQHFAECILTNSAPSVAGSDGLAAYAIARAATESLRSGAATPVPPLPTSTLKSAA